MKFIWIKNKKWNLIWNWKIYILLPVEDDSPERLFHSIRLPTKKSKGVDWNTSIWETFEKGIFKPDGTDLEFETVFAGCGHKVPPGVRFSWFRVWEELRCLWSWGVKNNIIAILKNPFSGILQKTNKFFF